MQHPFPSICSRRTCTPPSPRRRPCWPPCPTSANTRWSAEFMQGTPVAGTVFITGATGYLGQPLLAALIEGGYRVLALTRAQSARKLPRQAEAVIGDALDARSYAHAIPRGAVFVHLVGVAHPA